jgi:hypothetical protein
MARFETEILSTSENLKLLMDRSGQWIDQAHRRAIASKRRDFGGFLTN